jgi:hypothetical protein
MLPEIEVPEKLVALRKARDTADSDSAYIWGLARVYSDTSERQVEWDILCGIADMRKVKAWKAYELALNNYLDSQGGSDV